MSSLAPLMGRLCQVFSPRLCMFFSTMLICIGSVITSTSVSFEHFILGRIVTGAGGGGIFIVASIMAIQMTSPKRRGLYMGLANTAMTVGVSLGAVIAGALEPRIGWVSCYSKSKASPASVDTLVETPLWHSGTNQLRGRLRSAVLYPS
jgi:MFS family permease